MAQFGVQIKPALPAKRVLGLDVFGSVPQGSHAAPVQLLLGDADLRHLHFNPQAMAVRRPLLALDQHSANDGRISRTEEL